MKKAASTTTTVTYQEDALVISIATPSPESLHALLLKGLVASLRYFIQAEERLPADRESMVALTTLLEKITPGEQELQKGFAA
jgi:hypothetical protein